jgi:hypothetical protein
MVRTATPSLFTMKHVVSISLGSSSQDFDFTTTFLGQVLHVHRVGANGSTATAVKLIRQWEKKAAAIGLGVLKDHYTVGSRRFIARDSARLRTAATRVPVTTGGRLGDIFQEWAVRHAQTQLGSFFNNARVLFFSGMADYKLALSMSEHTRNLQFADPLLQLGVPKLLGSVEALNLYADGAHYVKDWTLPELMASGPVKEWTRFVLRKAMQKASVIVAPVHELDDFGLEELAGKTVITATVNDERVQQLRDKGVHHRQLARAGGACAGGQSAGCHGAGGHGQAA